MDKRLRKRVVGEEPVLASGLLPPLSTEEFEALASDIRANGVLNKVLVDEDGNVLDGVHRLRIDPKAPRKVVRGLSPGEKEAFVFRCNFVRRNLSGDQKAEARRKMRATASKLRGEDPKKWTQAAVAEALGVSRRTVTDWDQAGTRNGGSAKTSKPDARAKLDPKQKQEIFDRIESGESQERVASDFGISQQTVSRVYRIESKKRDAARRRDELAKTSATHEKIICADFRSLGFELDSFQMILTDPPYGEASIGLYRDVSALASRILIPGGWLLAYAGQSFLPQVYEAMSVEGMEYGWTFSVLHSGGDLRFRKFRVQNGWKPVIGFFKPPLECTWDWFKDVTTGGKEKSEHDWQQAEDEAAYFIEHLTSPDAIVLDPMCGSGTTLAAAKKTNRRWLGCDIDPAAVGTCIGRLA